MGWKPKKLLMKLIFSFLIFAIFSSLDARPYGSGLHSSEQVDFQRNWNQDLEREEKHPLTGFQKPYWKTNLPKHEKALKDYKRSLIRPLRQVENSVELKSYFLYTNGLDKVVSYENSNTGQGAGIEFDSRDFAWELSSRFPVAGYNVFASYLDFSPEDEFSKGNNANGYSLLFGNIVSEMTGVSNSSLKLFQVGNERFVGKKEESRFSILSGLSHMNFDQDIRVRGVDRLGLSQAVSNVLPGDPIVLEQGQETFTKDGTGAFVGLKYQSHLSNNMSLSTHFNIHLLKSDLSNVIQTQRVSQTGLIETLRNQSSSSETDTLVDFEWNFRKFFRHFYSVNLGFRYLQFLHKDRVRFTGETDDKFSVKGLSFSVQRFF